MAEKSLFYNAFPDEESATGYDRNYNADDISDWFSIVCDTGVLKGGLEVTASGGMNVSVSVGKATIRGKGYVNNSALSLTIASAPTGATPRYDMIILRMDNTQTQSARRTYIYVKSKDGVPTINDLTRDANVYELLIAYVIVNPNVTTITQGYIKDRRGNETYCPWFTAVKGYDDYYDAIVQQFDFNGTFASAGRTIVTNISKNLYNNKYSIIDVFCNGLKEENTDYTIGTSGSYITITFTAQKAAGSQISVILSNFIDGEGLSTAIGDYNNWVQAVENIQTAVGNYIYVCNGVNDNVNISNIVKAFYSVDDYSTLKLNVVGNFGMSAPVRGSGTSSDPYFWLDATKQVSTNRIATIDFSNCSEIQIPTNATVSGKYQAFIRCEVINIFGANIIFNDTTANGSFKVFSTQSGRIIAENCRFYITGYANCLIAYTGTFTNCRGSVANATGNSYCFMPYVLVRVNGGEYYAYTGDSTAQSAVIGQSVANAVSVLYAVNMPVVSRSGYYQTNSILQWSGGGQVRATDLITTLTDVIASGVIRDRISINKPNAM